MLNLCNSSNFHKYISLRSCLLFSNDFVFCRTVLSATLTFGSLIFFPSPPQEGRSRFDRKGCKCENTICKCANTTCKFRNTICTNTVQNQCKLKQLNNACLKFKCDNTCGSTCMQKKKLATFANSWKKLPAIGKKLPNIGKS